MICDPFRESFAFFQEIVDHVSQVRNRKLIKKYNFFCRFDDWLRILKVEKVVVNVDVKDIHFHLFLNHLLFFDVSPNYVAHLVHCRNLSFFGIQ